MESSPRRSCSMPPNPVTTVSVRPIRPKTRAQCWTFSLSEHYLHRALRRRERAEKRRAKREIARAARNNGYHTQPVEIIDLDPEDPAYPAEEHTEMILVPQPLHIEPLAVEIPQTKTAVDLAPLPMIDWYPPSTTLAVPVIEVNQTSKYGSPLEPCTNCARCNNHLTCQWMTGPSN